MRHALSLLVILLIASTLSAAPQLSATTETFIPGATWGGSAAVNPAGRLLTWNSFEDVSVAHWPNVDRRITLPKWTPSGVWHDAAPAIAAGPSTFLVVWSETTNTTVTYLAIRVAADLTLLDPRPIYLAATRRDLPSITPSVVWSGSDWIVGLSNVAMRISEQGVTRELIPLSNPSAIAAANGSVFIAHIGQQGISHCGFNPQFCTFASYFVAGRILGANGVSSDAPRLTSAERWRNLLAAGGSNAGFIVASVPRPSYTADGTVTVAVLGPNGIVHDEQTLDSTKDWQNTRVAFAGDGDRFLAAWYAQQDGGIVLRAAMLDAQGRGIGDPIDIGNRNEATGSISLTRMGEGRYLLVYARGLSGGAGLVVRELRYGGSGRVRAVR